MSNGIGAVILAAGTARRMGRQKLLLPLAGHPLLTHVLGIVGKFPWADCIAVIGEPEAKLAALCQAQAIRSVYNSKRQQGQATSIVLGVQQLVRDLAGIMFFLGDQPLVSQALIETLIGHFAQSASSKTIIVPCYQGQRYSPVLFGSYWLTALTELNGDTGGRQIMCANPTQVVEVNWPEKAAFYDADTWEDYQKLKQEIVD
ncbi:Molybdenum cofactor guanylyltransferase [Sporomusa silvacetica DSM 10669]|uniref:Molybdenum cofactor guanylyltransferase n=1 Tax=Sporomusa silvacetica DSM 10669 TaxID=1123289 RepID=A0ABZ3IR81_9FIRM|nr:nucleotidyltransferase family protein [Sporomusa silvacetica]OZC20662.1 bifunctional protein GlmU [Sporomusa silvacetica DSM 10669]